MASATTLAMQSSQRIKSHQKPNCKNKRKDKGRHKPAAQRAARARRQSLKIKLDWV